MSLQEAFFADIRQHPDDDVARLAYADWLEERGQPGDADQAAFVRLGCILARLPTDERCRQQHLLLYRQLRAACARRCHPSLAALGAVHFGYVGGLIDSLRIRPADFVRHGEELLRSCPVRTVYLRGVIGDLGRLGRMPDLPAVPILGVSLPWQGWGRDGGVVRLVESGKLHATTRLDLTITGVTGDEAGELARASYLSLVTALRLEPGWQRIGLVPALLENHGVAQLCDSPNLAGVRILSLKSQRLDDDGVIRLASTPTLANLDRLDLFGNAITSLGARALARSLFLGNLRELSLGNSLVDRIGLEALVSSTCLKALRRVNLHGVGRHVRGANPEARGPGRMLRQRFGPRGQLLHY